MRTAVVVVMVLTAGAPALAQEADKIEERLVQLQVKRLQRSLDLDDEQAEKVADIIRASMKKESEARKDRENRIRALLDDEQKEKHDEMKNKRFRPPVPDGENPFKKLGDLQKKLGGLMGKVGGVPSGRELKRPLGLNEDQVKAIDKISKDSFAAVREAMGEGEFDFSDIREEHLDRTREELTDDQKKLFEAYLEDPGKAMRPAPKRSVVDDVMKALDVEDEEEAAVVRDLVDKVIRSRKEMESASRRSKEETAKILKDDSLSDEDLAMKLDEFRARMKIARKVFRNACSELREVVNYRQELELLRRGIIE